jgi:hypothetical protein
VRREKRWSVRRKRKMSDCIPYKGKEEVNKMEKGEWKDIRLVKYGIEIEKG